MTRQERIDNMTKSIDTFFGSFAKYVATKIVDMIDNLLKNYLEGFANWLLEMLEDYRNDGKSIEEILQDGLNSYWKECNIPNEKNKKEQSNAER